MLSSRGEEQRGIRCVLGLCSLAIPPIWFSSEETQDEPDDRAEEENREAHIEDDSNITCTIFYFNVATGQVDIFESTHHVIEGAADEDVCGDDDETVDEKDDAAIDWIHSMPSWYSFSLYFRMTQMPPKMR